MIKQLFTKRRLVNILLIFEIIVIFGALILSYTTDHKMGMQRHMIYLNYKVEEIISINFIKVLILILLTTLITNILYNKIRLELKIDLNFIWTVTLILISIFYVLFIKKEINNSYYYISLLLSLGSMIQFIIYKLID